jgi:hypothetical protein
MAHTKSLCKLVNEGFIAERFREYRKLVRYSRYVCRDCGRTARKKANLCNPKPLYPKGKSVK